MRKNKKKAQKTCMLFLVLLTVGFLGILPTQARPRAKRVVILALDGISVPGFIQAQTPHLDTLLAEGALSTDTRVVMPSVTLPNWTSHLTGSGPEQHGVVDNGWEIKNKNFPPAVSDEKGYHPSVFQVLKEAIPRCKTAFYYNWINLLYPYNPTYLDEVSYLEKDAYVPNYEKALHFLITHQDAPTLVFLYSVHTDHAGHAEKWMSPVYIRSIEEADAEIGKFLDQLKREGLYEDTHFLFLSDHGGTGPGIRKGFKLTEPNNTVNTAATILHLFKVKQPNVWTGEVPMSIFK